MQSSAHDEYIDYSCSTSLERLARDVETRLRAWHVDQGSDRHVSVNQHPKKKASTTTTTSQLQAQLQENRHRVALIRSESIVWALSFHLLDGQQRIACQLQLELSLWDGPKSRYNHNIKSDDNNTLPFALHRTTTAGMDLPLDIMENFSNVFGIGQHITLAPVNPEHIPDDLLAHLYRSLWHRHETTTTCPAVLSSVLSGWLQTALNIAASFCHCCFPVVGVWGSYNPSRSSSDAMLLPPVVRTTPVLSISPPWIHSMPTASIRNVDQWIPKGRQMPHCNQHIMPPFVSGQLRSNDCNATFWCTSLDAVDKKWMEDNIRWTTWGSVLLHQCCRLRNAETKDTVHLWAARHIYSWYKPTNNNKRSRGFLAHGDRNTTQSWREHPPDNVPREIIETYRHESRITALDLLERFSACSDENPSWGPSDDPVGSMHAILTWNSPSSHPNEQSVDSSVSRDRIPLVTLPLKTRSTLTREDRLEMEKSIEQSVLDVHRPTLFHVKAFYDLETSEATLAATQRCVLAALIRASTLPRETLLSHLITESVISNWDVDAGNRIAHAVAVRASVDDSTQALVTAMDWKNAIENVIDHEQAEGIVHEVLDGRIALSFPTPPSRDLSELQTDDWTALQKSAPPGRLLSLLFVRMANVHSPPSMVLVWKLFVEELRRRWERRENLPNMNFVPGLDPPYDSSYKKKCFSTVGSSAKFAALINSFEPDPDDLHCLLGQKLQVFNICVESMLSKEMSEIEDLDDGMDDNDDDDDDMSESSFNQTISFGGHYMKDTIVDSLPGKNFSPMRDADDSSQRSQGTTRSQSTYRSHMSRLSTFFDAEEGNQTERNEETAIGIRKGVRCPVMGSTLMKTGDQVYAPYLQRPMPLTDDVIAQRRLMMARQKSTKASSTIKHRIEVAQRLQHPKLHSDMQAFKAANPGAVFEDFANWYGNPENPLEGFDQKDFSTGNLDNAAAASLSTKLDKAAEAIHVLDDTRKFWSRTWDEAKPIPAVNQAPLFDASTSVEMAIDYLETIHPASLICQVMAVNLAMAYFTLVVSAGEAVTVGVVRACLVRFREHVVTALGHLAHDATFGDRTTAESTNTMSVVSVESLAACGRACLSLSEAEVQVARARSLLNKLPQQVRLVESIMCKPPGSQIEIGDTKVQELILASIGKDQNARGNSSGIEPSIREYVLMNNDDTLPCHLCVKYQTKDDGLSNIVVAMTLSSQN